MKKTLSSFASSAIIFILALSPNTWAQQQKEQPLQELFQTEIVYPQQKGEIQFTLAPRFREDAEGEDEDFTEIPLSLQYGITDAWQVGLVWEAFVNRNPDDGESDSGIGDLGVGTKYSFMNIAGSNFHAAGLFQVVFPTGDVDEQLSDGFIKFEPSLILAKDFPELNDLQLFTQVGFSFVERVREPDDPEDEEPEAHEFILNGGFFIPIQQLVITAEINWNNNKWNNDGDKDELYLTPGLVWGLSKSWEIGAGMPVGLTDDSDDFRIIGMVVYSFDIKGR